MNILIVDDQRFIRESIKAEFEVLMQDHSLTFTEADCGNSAIELLMLSEQAVFCPYDLVIADLKMDNGDGLAIINHMATCRTCCGIPLAVVSSSDVRTLELISNITKSFNLNLVGVFQKPVDISQLFTLLTALKYKAPKSSYLNDTDTIRHGHISELLNQDNLILCYQPKIDIASQAIVGFEALSRLCIQGDGFIYPDRFIPLISEAGLNCHFSQLVIDQALSQWELCPQLQPFSLSVNISAQDLLNEAFIEYVIDKKHSLPNITLVLELTETQETIDQDLALRSIAKLIINDIIISLDDFGKSYSTFDRLDNIPFDEIKIDKDFISDLDRNAKHLAIVESTIALAKKLKVTVVAEGVETLSVLRLLKRLGCEVAQGYYFSPPIEGRYVTSWVENYGCTKENYG
ncbi:EAL domain-containing protein [Shewanella sp. UCD-KL12]|uniref:EAL domain-containing response regulator n=1 Tax=Shewanella sp. UCD-KL12 TaxID=1917163 RepID=UPI0009713A2B|nr:EAL domain-containing response regulator [Shewanella sp. UCD-KL12]